MGGGCVQKSQRCDGIDQCADKSDEWNCIKMDESKDKNTTFLQVSANKMHFITCCFIIYLLI